jgi:hypothetical protein
VEFVSSTSLLKFFNVSESFILIHSFRRRHIHNQGEELEIDQLLAHGVEDFYPNY